MVGLLSVQRVCSALLHHAIKRAPFGCLLIMHKPKWLLHAQLPHTCLPLEKLEEGYFAFFLHSLFFLLSYWKMGQMKKQQHYPSIKGWSLLDLYFLVFRRVEYHWFKLFFFLLLLLFNLDLCRIYTIVRKLRTDPISCAKISFVKIRATFFLPGKGWIILGAGYNSVLRFQKRYQMRKW